MCDNGAAPIEEGVIVAVETFVNCPCGLYVITGTTEDEPAVEPVTVVFAIDIVTPADNVPPFVSDKPVPTLSTVDFGNASVIPYPANVVGVDEIVLQV